MKLARRTFVAGVASLAALRPAFADADPIASLERQHGGRLGVFALDTGSGRMLAHRADERFLLCSTFKGPLAAFVLSRAASGEDSLASMVRFSARDLKPHSPVTQAHLSAGALPVGTLCQAILTDSDNAAANLLLARVGGPAALTAYVRGLGDDVTRFDRYELAVGERSGQLDTTTPRAIAGTARTLLLGTALPFAARTTLERWMAECVQGRVRLRASFPSDWIACDRTGTGDGECNDFAVARRYGRAPLVMAAYYDHAGMEMETQEAVLREVGAALVAWSREA